LLFKPYFYIGKRRSTTSTKINHSIQSMVNKENISAISNISIRSMRLVDIANNYRKLETNLTKIFTAKDENQFYVEKMSAKKTSIINNKQVNNYLNFVWIQ